MSVKMILLLLALACFLYATVRDARAGWLGLFLLTLTQLL